MKCRRESYTLGAMASHSARTISVAILYLLGELVAAQNPPAAAPSLTGDKNHPDVTFHASTRIVELQVVARDHQGKPVSGLTANDFQIFEQRTGRKKETREQKIAVFQPIAISDLAAQAPESLKLPAGVYTNLVTLRKLAVPPTILLLDGLNTEVSAQMQVHRQMIRMLGSMPKDVPVAVFLLGRHLKMLQGFTADPKLLKAALEKASSVQTPGSAPIDTRDDPDALSGYTENMLANDPNMANSPVEAIFLQVIQGFERETFASNLDMRVRTTEEALISLAHNVSGYPGRKNLLWISSSFPIVLNADMKLSDVVQNAAGGRTPAPAFRPPDQSAFMGMRNYAPEMQKVEAALSEAKTAIYPIDITGVSTEAFFDASSRTRAHIADTGAPAIREMAAIDRENVTDVSRHDTMEDLAEETGGRTCIQDNDLGDCVRHALEDSSAFYEISYYPTWTDWNGEFRKIIVKTKRRGLRLGYRQGYFAQPQNQLDPKTQETTLRQSACEDYLNATSILVIAQPLPSGTSPGLKYYLAIDSARLTFTPTANNARQLKINVAACTFDQTGKPLELINDPIDRSLTSNEYESVLRRHGLTHVITVQGQKPAAVRLVVQDVPSGRLGSVNLPVEP